VNIIYDSIDKNRKQAVIYHRFFVKVLKNAINTILKRENKVENAYGV
jgi:hypothetical protein